MFGMGYCIGIRLDSLVSWHDRKHDASPRLALCTIMADILTKSSGRFLPIPKSTMSYHIPPPPPRPSSITFPLTSLALTPPLGRMPPSLISTPLLLTTLPPPLSRLGLPCVPNCLAFEIPTNPGPARFPVLGASGRASLPVSLKLSILVDGGFISSGRGSKGGWFSSVYSKGADCTSG